LFGQKPATQIGIRGRWRGVGSILAPARRNARPARDGLAGPEGGQHLEALVENAGSLSLVERLSHRLEVAPTAEADADDEPSPREPVECCRLLPSFQGRRRANAVTSAPKRTRPVASAIAVNATVVSVSGAPGCGAQKR
jgi:hypothetical protein